MLVLETGCYNSMNILKDWGPRGQLTKFQPSKEVKDVTSMASDGTLRVEESKNI